ncbi:hypothetical protein GTY87_05045 [Streptomyces sp. SID7813]|uniref:Uncharacterized protein n=1 Tax=Streptomyces coelicolor (strain ATCC BAA-471 / A3(2) / M145) TaxID=100226 RepID=Q9EX25_STRCO|nr:hypothetical protein [Streptomyces sp. SID7813]QFI41251.1 hypothetical protein FQ762_05085 [Streptomyces coelicolor A3(2)]THA81628.1 hypothetical protein E6R61_35720 [Streptomyces sp. LRa12]CAC14383.1 hypothetical protein 2SCG2.29c [Streptomyces coelicolor A3(2)]
MISDQEAQAARITIPAMSTPPCLGPSATAPAADAVPLEPTVSPARVAPDLTGPRRPAESDRRPGLGHTVTAGRRIVDRSAPGCGETMRHRSPTARRRPRTVLSTARSPAVHSGG